MPTRQEPIPGTPPNYPHTPHIGLQRGLFFWTPHQAILGPYGVLRPSDRISGVSPALGGSACALRLPVSPIVPNLAGQTPAQHNISDGKVSGKFCVFEKSDAFCQSIKGLNCPRKVFETKNKSKAQWRKSALKPSKFCLNEMSMVKMVSGDFLLFLKI